MKRIVLYIVFGLLSFGLFSQSLKTELDQESIQIGEPFTVSFIVSSVDPFDSIFYESMRTVFLAKSTDENTDIALNIEYELELLRPFEDTQFVHDNLYFWKGSYTLTGWDSAFVVLPPERIVINDSTFYFPVAMIQIISPIADPTKDIYDINEEFTDIESDEFSLKAFLSKHWWWLIIILIIISIFSWKWIKNKPKEKIVAPISLRDRIIKEINALEKSKGYETDLKEYYFQLSVIVRKFLSEHYQLRLMEYTTSEIRGVLKQRKISSDTIDVIEKLLNQSDMVKFAKSEPPLNEVFMVTNEARQIVDEVASLNLKENE
jgi:hypothetical protein